MTRRFLLLCAILCTLAAVALPEPQDQGDRATGRQSGWYSSRSRRPYDQPNREEEEPSFGTRDDYGSRDPTYGRRTRPGAARRPTYRQPQPNYDTRQPQPGNYDSRQPPQPQPRYDSRRPQPPADTPRQPVFGGRQPPPVGFQPPQPADTPRRPVYGGRQPQPPVGRQPPPPPVDTPRRPVFGGYDPRPPVYPAYPPPGPALPPPQPEYPSYPQPAIPPPSRPVAGSLGRRRGGGDMLNVLPGGFYNGIGNLGGSGPKDFVVGEEGVLCAATCRGQCTIRDRECNCIQNMTCFNELRHRLDEPRPDVLVIAPDCPNLIECSGPCDYIVQWPDRWCTCDRKPTTACRKEIGGNAYFKREADLQKLMLQRDAQMDELKRAARQSTKTKRDTMEEQQFN